MAEHSKIEWTDATWNPITGCSIKSPGCIHCYAMRLAGSRLRGHPSRKGLTKASKAGPVWTGEVRFNEYWLTQPLGWKTPRMVFVCAHGDLFHENVPDEWIDRVLAVMALCPQHTFQVLTKRAERMHTYLSGDRFAEAHASERIGYAAMEIMDGLAHVHAEAGVIAASLIHGPTPKVPGVIWPRPEKWPLPNVWLGISAERQQEADERIPHLLATPAAFRFVSAEPLLGPIDMSRVNTCAATGGYSTTQFIALDWIIVGGESGDGARPMHPNWARSLRDQCLVADVPFFFKQWGEYAPMPIEHPIERGTVKVRGCRRRAVDMGNGFAMVKFGKKAAGRTLDGVKHDAWPRAAKKAEAT